MRKNINKLIAVAIGVSVMSGSIVPVFAADTTQNTSTTTTVQAQTIGKTLLTLDDAIKAAVSNSETLTLDEQKISYQDNINDTNKKLDDFTGVNGDKEDLNNNTRDNSLNQAKQQSDFDEDKLIQKTTTAYNSIVTSQKQIDKAAKTLEIKNKELNDAKLKNSLGITTTTDLTGTKLQIETLQNQQKSSQNALNDAEYSFKVLTGKDVTQYTLEQDIKYDTFKIDGSVDDYLDNSIDSYLNYKTQLIQLNKDYYNDSNNQVSASDVNTAETDSAAVVVPPKPGDGNLDPNAYQKYEDKLAEKQKYAGTLSARLLYLNTRLGVYTQETTLNETKKQFKEQLRTFYTNILALEDNITTLKKNIDLNNKQISNAKLKYDLGLITKSDYNTQVLSTEDLDLQLRGYINQYNTLKEEIQKPWIAFS